MEGVWEWVWVSRDDWMTTRIGEVEGERSSFATEASQKRGPIS
jgi:hypothetical protein